MEYIGKRFVRQAAVGITALALLVAVAGLLVRPSHVEAQSGTGSSIVILQVTLGSGATQISASQIQVRQIIVQNNAAHLMRVGDSSVTTSKGIYLAAGPGGGSVNSGPVSIYHTFLSDWYVAGTNGDVVDILYEK